MKRSFRLFTALCLLVSGITTANLVINGGFESPNIPYQSLAIYESIPGWVTTYGFSVEIQDHWGYGLPYEGQQFLELDGYESSGILQNIATQAGNYYQFSFAYAGRGAGEAGENEIDVYWNGQLLDELRTTTVYEWFVKVYTVKALDSLTTIEFRDVGESTSYGGYLDAVSVIPIPEPCALLLLGLGSLLIRKR